MADNSEQAVYDFIDDDLYSHTIISSVSYYLGIRDYQGAAEYCCEALEAYVNRGGGGGQYSNVWSLFKKGGTVLDEGLEYIDYMKENVGNGQSKDFKGIMQLFLECSALYNNNYQQKNTNKSLDHDVLIEAEVFKNAGFVKYATAILVWYLVHRSLWGNGDNGWPLHHFSHKDELSREILSLAKLESDDYYHLVYSELEVLSDQCSRLKTTANLLQASQRNNSLRGEILSVRKILDFHLSLSFFKYDLENNYVPVDDLKKHCEEKMFEEKVSVTTLLFYWNMWKENVLRIFETVGFVNCVLPDKYADFSLNYFGVRKLCANEKMVCLLVDKDAEWIRKYGQEGVQVRDDGKLLTIESKQLVFAIRSYWQSQLFSVGMKVLKTLESLLRSKSDGSVFHKSTCLVNIYEVSKFLLDCKHLNLTLQQKTRLQKFFGLSMAYFDHVFPLNWHESVSYDMVSLIDTDLSLNLVDEILVQNADISGNQALGRVMLLLLFSPRKPGRPLEKMISLNLQNRFAWIEFLSRYLDFGLKHIYVADLLLYALEVTWKDFQTLPFDMSPHCFLHLLDSALFMKSCCSGTFFTAKSSFVGFLPQLQSIASACSIQMRDHFRTTHFIDLVTQILFDKKKTKSWIRTSKINVASYYPLLNLRMAMMLCLICLENPDLSEFVSESLFVKHHIDRLLPKEFVKKLKFQTGQSSSGFNFSLQNVSEAFMSVGDPLIVVTSEGDVNTRMKYPCVIYHVDLRKTKEEITSVLFERETPLHVQNSLQNDDRKVKEVRINWNVLEEISKATNVKLEEISPRLKLLPEEATIKEILKMNKEILNVAVECGKSVAERDSRFVRVVMYQLEKLHSAIFPLRMLFLEEYPEDIIKYVQRIVEKLQGSRPRIDKFLSQYIISQESEDGPMELSECSNTTTTEVKEKYHRNMFDMKLQWWQL